MSRRFDETTRDLVLDEHLMTSGEVYKKLKDFQKKKIYLSQSQRGFITKYEGKTEARRPYAE